MTVDYKDIPLGGYVLGDDLIEYNIDYEEVTIKVRNSGDRPIQVGSHYHFFEVNSYLEFDRAKAFGKRLNIPATTGLRFEAGDEREVSLVSYRGKQRIIGFNGLVDGWAGSEKEHAYRPDFINAMEKATKLGFSSKTEE